MQSNSKSAMDGGFARLRRHLHFLYHSRARPARLFQTCVVTIDLLIIAFFIATPMIRDASAFLWYDYAIAIVLAVDLTCRGLAETDLKRWLRQPTVIVDIFILITLLFPAYLANLGFLRILRLWSLSRSGFLWRPLSKRQLARWQQPVQAVLNLVTFLFVATGFIYTFFFRFSPGFAGYIDALYFTVATVTTTGFGDITLPGPWGKLTAIVTMICGISLFVRLAQSIFRPNKVYFPCPRCALQMHDPDAVHCKACGEILAIPDDGNS
ncbi:potassium channel family protein [Kaistia sp. UC242_56]|uniref:potassium channel family protein n=1 Tax=Kaistia sp. UC242_56 TaxID=3374625 RepID=UPI0037888E16